MIFGNCIIELKLVEKLRLFALQPSHHGFPPPRFVSARWNHGSPQASTTSATKAAQSRRAEAQLQCPLLGVSGQPILRTHCVIATEDNGTGITRDRRIS